MIRDFYIPKGARKVRAKDLPAGVEVFAYERDGKFFAVGFRAKSRKPAFHYHWRSEARRTEYVGQFFEGIRSHLAYTAKRRADASKPHAWEKGLILYGSWGYDQTNVDFFEVVRIVGKNMVEVEQIGSQAATDATEGFMSTSVVPDPEVRTGKITKHKVVRGSIKSPVYGNAWPWDGKPRYCSWYA